MIRYNWRACSDKFSNNAVCSPPLSSCGVTAQHCHHEGNQAQQAITHTGKPYPRAAAMPLSMIDLATIQHVLRHTLQVYIKLRAIIMIAFGVLITAMSVIGCLGAHRQIRRDRELLFIQKVESAFAVRAIIVYYYYL